MPRAVSKVLNSPLSDQTRRVLLDAARNAFASTGYQATSIDDITNLAEVTKGALYYHFRDKVAVFDAVLVEMENEAGIYVEQRVRNEPDRSKKFAVGLDSYLSFCSSAAYRRIVVQDGPSALGMKRFREIDTGNAERLIVAPLQFMAKAGEIQCDDIPLLGHMIGGMVWEAILLLAESGNKRGLRAKMVLMIHQLLDLHRPTRKTVISKIAAVS